MIDEILEQLQSIDPEERTKAIVTLGRLRNKVALKPLEDVHRNDPDPDVRALALKVARYIQFESTNTSPIRGTVTEPEFLPGVNPWEAILPPAKRRGPKKRVRRRPPQPLEQERKPRDRYVALLVLIVVIAFMLLFAPQILSVLK